MLQDLLNITRWLLGFRKNKFFPAKENKQCLSVAVLLPASGFSYFFNLLCFLGSEVQIPVNFQKASNLYFTHFSEAKVAPFRI